MCVSVCHSAWSFCGGHKTINGTQFSLFLPCGSWGLNSSCQAWWQALLSTEPSHWLFLSSGRSRSQVYEGGRISDSRICSEAMKSYVSWYLVYRRLCPRICHHYSSQRNCDQWRVYYSLTSPRVRKGVL